MLCFAQLCLDSFLTDTNCAKSAESCNHFKALPILIGSAKNRSWELFRLTPNSPTVNTAFVVALARGHFYSTNYSCNG
jgi:hypothetical protein